MGALRPSGQAALKPVVDGLPDGIDSGRAQAAVELGVQRLELVPDFGLGAPGDLEPVPLPVRPEAERDRPDLAVLGGVEVDRVLAVPATACR
jgi:hypothetical protein